MSKLPVNYDVFRLKEKKLLTKLIEDYYAGNEAVEKSFG